MRIHSFIYFNVFFVCIYFHVSYSLCLCLSFIYSLMYRNIYNLGFITLYACVACNMTTTRTTRKQPEPLDLKPTLTELSDSLIFQLV